MTDHLQKTRIHLHVVDQHSLKKKQTNMNQLQKEKNMELDLNKTDEATHGCTNKKAKT